MSIPYTDWNATPPREPFTRCSPNLVLIRDWLLATFGGQPLGCYGLRTIRGGSSWSTHAYGAALDWRYESVGAGYRNITLDDFRAFVLPVLIGNADALGIQQLHDYRAGSIWRTGRGWRSSTGAGMGEAWATYVHIETNSPQWFNELAIELRGIAPIEYNPTDPTEQPPMTNTLSIPHTTLKRGGTGTGKAGEPPSRAVWRVQAILQDCWGSPELVVDGRFGAMTEAAVKRMQSLAHITVDGIVGPQTATVLYSS